MAGKIRLLCVGKLKIPFYREACAHYLTRIGHHRQILCTELRDGASSLPVERRKAEEGQRILGALAPNDVLIVLDEHGTALTSPQLAQLLQKLEISGAGTPCFAVGGAYGLDSCVLDRAYRCISLSPMTFPHELARVILLEQLYRADCILRNSPYHH